MDDMDRLSGDDLAEASSNHGHFCGAKRAYPSREPMHGTEDRLAPSGFVRVHRAAIVSLERLPSIVPGESGDAAVPRDGGRAIRVGRRCDKTLRERVETVQPAMR
jgi:DNA-binding LytR/AlgR family response regulator